MAGWQGINDGGATESGVNVTSDLTTVCTIKIPHGANELLLEIYNADKQLSDFNVDFKSHSSGNWINLFSVPSDYTTNVEEPLNWCSNDPTTLAAASSALMKFYVKAVNSLRIQAAAQAVSDTDIIVYWQVR